jgi:hypothetical protein
MDDRKRRRGLIPAAALLAGGAVAGAVLAGTLSAGAATTPTPTATSGTTTDPHPGDNGADGIPENQEHHGGGHGLDLSGTVTAVGGDTVTIKTSTSTTTYKVDSNSDIDKNGEAQLSSLAVGDAVRFSVGSGTKTIDKLHAGDETKDRPAAPSSESSSGTGA